MQRSFAIFPVSDYSVRETHYHTELVSDMLALSASWLL